MCCIRICLPKIENKSIKYAEEMQLLTTTTVQLACNLRN
jgi:hypothetical protein